MRPLAPPDHEARAEGRAEGQALQRHPFPGVRFRRGALKDAEGQALQRHPFPGVRIRRGALTHWLSGSSDHRAEIRLATPAAAAATFDQPGRSVGRLAR
jgi:hypothetical protein